jgi:ApbE superfamily uncharacterized protein (UPF0280 family)
MGPQRSPLPGGRWHWQHGPIDIVAHAEGTPDAVAAAHAQAWARFETVLPELVAELPLLREPVLTSCPLKGEIARSMWQTCAPYRAGFITPMAAVAGAVAQALIASYRREGISRAWINNGGDIALHLAPGQALRVGLYADLSRLTGEELAEGLALDGCFDVAHTSSVRGVATSGWRGRSFSLGIADSVTVLASTAAQADAAATVIANAVNTDDGRVQRRPACELKDDSDLGERLVTVDVPTLDREVVSHALAAGANRARELRQAGLIRAAALVCQGQHRVIDLARGDLVQDAALGDGSLAPQVGSVFA